MEEAFVALLLADPAIGALVEARINWNEKPQGSALPAIVLHKVSGVRDYTLASASGLVESRVQADCLAATYAGSLDLARKVTARLSGVGGEFSGKRLEMIRLVSELQRLDKPDDQPPRHRVSLDFEFWHDE